METQAGSPAEKLQIQTWPAVTHGHGLLTEPGLQQDRGPALMLAGQGKMLSSRRAEAGQGVGRRDCDGQILAQGSPALRHGSAESQSDGVLEMKQTLSGYFHALVERGLAATARPSPFSSKGQAVTHRLFVLGWTSPFHRRR